MKKQKTKKQYVHENVNNYSKEDIVKILTEKYPNSKCYINDLYSVIIYIDDYEFKISVYKTEIEIKEIIDKSYVFAGTIISIIIFVVAKILIDFPLTIITFFVFSAFIGVIRAVLRLLAALNDSSMLIEKELENLLLNENNKNNE